MPLSELEKRMMYFTSQTKAPATVRGRYTGKTPEKPGRSPSELRICTQRDRHPFSMRLALGLGSTSAVVQVARFSSSRFGFTPDCGSKLFTKALEEHTSAAAIFDHGGQR
ncbi:MAG: hypothetical protein JWO71_495 [Candidatus Acidoferrum typicum]|nr:hypothetical protein [Candidatus Acidoferrum typicum]